jgi:hypothetical protein
MASLKPIEIEDLCKQLREETEQAMVRIEDSAERMIDEMKTAAAAVDYLKLKPLATDLAATAELALVQDFEIVGDSYSIPTNLDLSLLFGGGWKGVQLGNVPVPRGKLRALLFIVKR